GGVAAPVLARAGHRHPRPGRHPGAVDPAHGRRVRRGDRPRPALRTPGRAQRGQLQRPAGRPMNNTASIVAVVLVSITSVAVGAFGLRLSRTMSDFYVASRGVRPVLNASAISGEYLSAASFLGVAGLILARGVDILWLPVGWTAGYLLL